MASTLFEKYQQSLSSAKLLKDTYYSSTVNRSYYACIQFMLHILFDKLKINRKDFEVQRRQNKDGTHGWASKLIEIQLAHKDVQDFKWYQRTFPEFQKLRESADYSDDIITQTESINSISTAESLINCIRKHIK